jgi:3-oxoacyl-[acyl-carrier-protein] synthase III
MGSDGNFSDILIMPGGGSACPVTPENFHQKLNTIKMLGKETYKQAVIAMTGAAIEVLDICGLTPADVKCVIPHQANIRIIEAIADRLKMPMDQFFVNLDLYGNTSAAAVAVALDEANRSGRFQRGDNLLLVVFGGGLTWASAVIEW